MRFVSDIYLTDWMWETLSSTQPALLPPWPPCSSPQEILMAVTKEEWSIPAVSQKLWVFFFFLNKAADGVNIILPTSASVSSSLLSSCNWSSPNTESLGVAVMLCQQRALCHLGVDMHYLANLSQCLALENTCLKGAVDLRQRIHYHKPEFKPF